MKVFFLDLWMDLREKRLAPVAIILLAAVIAVPIVLANGKDETTTTPASTNPSATVASATVIKGQTSEGTQSKLQTFKSRDPFEPTVRIAATSTSTTTSSGTSGTSTGTSGSSTTSSGSTSGGGTTGSVPSTSPTAPSGTG